MTHLMKLGPAPLYHAQTECGMTVSTLAIVDANPTCAVCAHVDELEEAECRQTNASQMKLP